MIRSLHPSRFGFWGGCALGFLVALFAFGDLARFIAFTTPAEAQFAPAFRIMDGAHTQLATVDHSGRLLVSTGSTSGLTDHITSVTHVAGSVRILSGTPNNQAAFVTHSGSLAVTCYTNAGVAETCGGSGGGDTVNVFHQSTIRHISSVTHIAGAASIVDRAGNYVTVTGGELNVACSGCAAASVVAVTHISGAVHVVNSFGQALHMQGLGVPGGSHGGVLTVQGITGMNPIFVSQSTAAWNIAHITSVAHVYGRVNLIDRAGNYVTVTAGALDVNCTGCSSSATVHISAALHVAGTLSGARFHIQGVGTPGQSHGGVLTVQGATGMNPVFVSQSTANWTIAHISTAVHLAGGVTDNANSALRVTGVTVFTIMGAVDHIAGSVHLAGSISGAKIHMQGVGTPGASHGGVLTVQGVTGMNPVVVSQSTQRWNVDHITSVTHVRGSVFLTNQAGASVTTTSNALDVNCTGCSSSATVHISAALHLAGSIQGAQIHIQGVGTPGQSHGGVLTVQGTTGMNALSVSQSTARWNVDHVTSATHVVGRVFLTNTLGTAVTVTGTALDVNCTGCAAATVVEVDHISSVVHIVGYAGAALHIQGLGTPGQSHGGVLSIQGVNNGNAVAVSQSLAAWNIAHISTQLHVANTTVLNSLAVRCVNTGATAFESCAGTGSGDAVNVFHQSTIRHISSVTHVSGGISLLARDGTYATLSGTSLNVNLTNTPAVTQNGEWNVRHVTTVTHVVLVSSGHANVIRQHIGGSFRAWRVANCGTTASLVVASNPDRRDLILQNLGGPGVSGTVHGNVYLGYGTRGHVALTINNGFILHSMGFMGGSALIIGGETTRLKLDNYQGPLACIAATAGVQLSIIEMLR